MRSDRRQSSARSVPGVILGLLVILAAVGSLRVHPFGHATLIRPLVGMVGIIGAICLFRGSGWWRILLTAWCLCQCVIIATDVSGEWFYQGLRLGFWATRSETARLNGVITRFSETGWSTTGLILLIPVLIVMLFGLHPRRRARG